MFTIHTRVWPAAGIFHAETTLIKMSLGAAEKAEQFGLGEIELGGTITYGEGNYELPARQRPLILGMGYRAEFDLADLEDAEARASAWNAMIKGRIEAAADTLVAKERTVGETTDTYIPD